MKILAHSKDPRGNELVTFQFKFYTFLIPKLLKHKDLEVTWAVNPKEYNGEIFELNTSLVTLTTTKSALIKFFDKSCPIHSVNEYIKDNSRSLKELNRRTGRDFKDYPNRNKSTPQPLQDIAEEMYDLYNESKAVELKELWYHIPFEKDFYLDDSIFDLIPLVNGRTPEYVDFTREELSKLMDEVKIKISTALISNPQETDYNKLIKMHDLLLENNELDTFVHCARVMTDEEYYSYIKGKISLENTVEDESKNYGWCENYRGFVSYKNIIENETNYN